MERVCFSLQVRPDCLDEYKRRHQNVWLDMREALSSTGWHDYSLFLRDDGLLIGYLVTPNFQEALNKMAALEVNERWQQEMKPFFVGLEGRPDQVMQRLEEVFHLP
jgi:L-rhamnose mutarotase